MNDTNRRFIQTVYWLGDFAASVVSFYSGRYLWEEWMKNGTGKLTDSFPVLLVFVIAFSLAGFFMEQYEVHKLVYDRKPITDSISAAVLAIVFMILFLFVLQWNEIPWGLLLTASVLNVILITLKNVLIHKLLKTWLINTRYRKVVVAGDGPLAEEFRKNAEENPSLGYKIVGFFGKEMNAAGYLGPYAAMNEYLASNQVDEVVLALDGAEFIHAREVISYCEQNGTRVSAIPLYNDVMPVHPVLEMVGNSKLINLRSNPLDMMSRAFLKRSFDIVVSSLLLLLLSPLFLLLAVGVKLSSPGPVFFVQERVGWKKKHFNMLKFRSMSAGGTVVPEWSSDTGHRTTRFGAIMRKLSLDELPQLINVLKGEMSLIGPRPEMPYYVERFKQSVPLYMVKHQVRPGMTGWAQVNGWRGNTSIEKRIEYDVWYIENWSVELEIRIMAKTILGGFINHETFPDRKGSDK